MLNPCENDQFFWGWNDSFCMKMICFVRMTCMSSADRMAKSQAKKSQKTSPTLAPKEHKVTHPSLPKVVSLHREKEENSKSSRHLQLLLTH
jgi:hypothetical protein